MIWTYRGHPIPMEIYHGVPMGWYAHEIISEHARLGGTFNLRGNDATEPGAPTWLPERYDWLQYRQTLYRVADGVLTGDAACVELAIRYIELRHIGSYSGYIRARICRRLKHATLMPTQRSRIHQHFAELVINDELTHEFSEYVKLWRRLITDAELESLISVLRHQPTGPGKVPPLLALLRPAQSLQRTISGTR